jgi:hypothetical protein
MRRVAAITINTVITVTLLSLLVVIDSWLFVSIALKTR